MPEMRRHRRTYQWCVRTVDLMARFRAELGAIANVSRDFLRCRTGIRLLENPMRRNIAEVFQQIGHRFQVGDSRVQRERHLRLLKNVY